MKIKNVVSYPPKLFGMKIATKFHPKGNTQLPNPTIGVFDQSFKNKPLSCDYSTETEPKGQLGQKQQIEKRILDGKRNRSFKECVVLEDLCR